MNCIGKKIDERYIQILSYAEPPTLEMLHILTIAVGEIRSH